MRVREMREREKESERERERVRERVRGNGGKTGLRVSCSFHWDFQYWTTKDDLFRLLFHQKDGFNIFRSRQGTSTNDVTRND